MWETSRKSRRTEISEVRHASHGPFGSCLLGSVWPCSGQTSTTNEEVTGDCSGESCMYLVTDKESGTVAPKAAGFFPYVLFSFALRSAVATYGCADGRWYCGLLLLEHALLAWHLLLVSAVIARLRQSGFVVFFARSRLSATWMVG